MDIFTRLLAPSALLVSLVQLPAASIVPQADIAQEVMATAVVNAGVVQAETLGGSSSREALAGVFFGQEATTAQTRATIDSKIEFVRTRKAYPASLAVIQRHEKTIKDKARERGVPEEVAIGIGLLENGGSDTAKSPAGALGVFQLMPGTARNLGLIVNGKVDQRRIPELNIDAGMRYLALNYSRFGDWGLSTWAYHAGEGNVAKALKIYAKANHGVNLPGIGQAHVLRSYVEKYGITIHKLLSDPSVRVFTNRLKDDSSGYPYKVVATATLFEEASQASELTAR